MTNIINIIWKYHSRSHVVDTIAAQERAGVSNRRLKLIDRALHKKTLRPGEMRRAAKTIDTDVADVKILPMSGLTATNRVKKELESVR